MGWGERIESSKDPIRKEALELLAEYVDDDECRYDHHGHCQTHGSTDARLGCHNSRALDLLGHA